MKKIVKCLVFLFLTIPTCFSQTSAIEIEYCKNLYESGKIDIYKYQKYGKEWQEMIKNVGYPVLPFNQDTTDVFFGYVIQFDSLNKTIIYERLEEWLALHYSNLNDIIDYQDFDMGKIILKNSIYISPLKYRNYFSPNSVNYTSLNRFTVKENKLRVEIFQINYSYNYSGSSSAESYIPPYSYTYPLMSLFPICKSELDSWEMKSYILQWTIKDIGKMVEELDAFISDYKNDYNF